VPGDIFADRLPDGYDVHLWSNALHDWDSPTIRALLKKSFSALPDGGKVVIYDSHINREKTGPLPVANYSVFLMTSTEGKCYSVAEMEDFLAEAGFHDPAWQPAAQNHSAVIAIK
jgi:hypothetical protein